MSLLAANNRLLVPPAGGEDQNLVAHWTLDETTGTVAADSGPNGWDASGADFDVHGKPGPVGNALYIGSAPLITAGNVPILNSATALTVSLWADTNSSSARRGFITQYGSSAANGKFGLMTAHANPQKVMLIVSDGTNIRYPQSVNDVLALGAWKHVVFTGDIPGDNYQCYIDGVAVSTSVGGVPISSLAASSTLPLYLGYWTGGGYASAVVDDIRVYDKVLSQEEITALYNLGTIP